MTRLLRALAIAALAGTTIGASALAHEAKVGDLVLTDLWTRATPGGAKVAGGYFTITNKGAAPDRLVSATSPVAGKVEVHEMSMNNGVMTMRPLDAGLPIAVGKSISLAPGGYHLMMMDLKQPLKEGENTPVSLQFEKAGKVDTVLHVRGVGAKGPADDAARKGHSH